MIIVKSVASSLSLYCFVVLTCTVETDLLEPVLQALTTVPLNTAVELGKPTTFYCASDSHLLIWSVTLQRNASETVEQIFNGIAINPDYIGVYDVDSSILGQANLIIISSNATEPGVYTCKETTVNDEYTASLVVLDSAPICTVNTSSSDVSFGVSLVMKCTVTYTTNLSPMLMSWFDPSGQPVISEDSVEPGRTESFITVTAKPPRVGNYACRVNFSEPTNATTTAQNAPAYTYVYTSPEFPVFFCPTSVIITVPSGNMNVGDTLECSSDGYPAASFQWTCRETGEVTTGSNLTLKRYGHFTYVCQATVTFGETSCDFSETVNVNVGARSCLQMQQENPRMASGTYAISLTSGRFIEVYCEIGLGDGGYTFLSPASLVDSTDDDLQTLFTNRTQFLMRLRKGDGTQPFAVIKQLDRYSDIPLMVGLSSNTGYETPANTQDVYLGLPYLYFGFLPKHIANTTTTWGLNVNAVEIPTANLLGYTGNYIALIPGFSESSWFDFVGTQTYEMCTSIFSTNVRPVPSARVMPDSYFMFIEVIWQGTNETACGITSNCAAMNDLNIRSAAIGFK